MTARLSLPPPFLWQYFSLAIPLPHFPFLSGFLIYSLPVLLALPFSISSDSLILLKDSTEKGGVCPGNQRKSQNKENRHKHRKNPKQKVNAHDQSEIHKKNAQRIGKVPNRHKERVKNRLLPGVFEAGKQGPNIEKDKNPE